MKRLAPLSLILIIVLTLSSSLLAQKVTVDKRLKGLDEELEKVLAELHVVGVGVAIVEKNQILYSKGLGYADLDNKVRADQNTLFAIGSCSKAFTSAILGNLSAENKLKFTDSPIQYIPELQFSKDYLNSQVTIQDLMSHRTGLPRHDFSWYMFPTFSKDSLITRIKYMDPFTGIREQWYYNNFAFLIQGVIGERITGNSWSENVRSMFFEPLGMKRSNLSIAELNQSDNRSLGYSWDKDHQEKLEYYKIAGMAPAGSINSSASEMANWVITWINDGKFNGKQIIPSAYRNDAISSHMVIAAGLPSKEVPDAHLANYGDGWFLSSYKGHYRVEHGGNIDGFSASTSFFPTDSIGIVVLVNQNGSAAPTVIRNIIADRMLKENKTDWLETYTTQIKKQEEAMAKISQQEDEGQKKGTNHSHSLLEYEGTYSHPGYGSFNITFEDGMLIIALPRMKMGLTHYHYDVFKGYELKDGKLKDEGQGMQIQFSTNLSGDIEGAHLKIEPTLDPLLFKRVPIALKVASSDLKKYEGNYMIGPQNIKVYLKGNVLYLFVAGQPEYELMALEPNKFKFKSVEGFKVNFEEQDGKVTAAELIQPNGTFKAERKN